MYLIPFLDTSVIWAYFLLDFEVSPWSWCPCPCHAHKSFAHPTPHCHLLSLKSCNLQTQIQTWGSNHTVLTWHTLCRYCPRCSWCKCRHGRPTVRMSFVGGPGTKTPSILRTFLNLQPMPFLCTLGIWILTKFGISMVQTMATPLSPISKQQYRVVQLGLGLVELNYSI